MGSFSTRLAILFIITLAFILGLLLWVDSLNTPDFRQSLARAEKEGQEPLEKTWREYFSTVGGFQVDFPGYPQHAQETKQVPNSTWSLDYQLYVAQDIQGADFMVSMVEYPNEMDMSDTDLVLGTVLDEMKTVSPSNVVKDLDGAPFRGYPSLRFTVEGSDRVIHSRALLVNHKLYLLMVAHVPGLNLDSSYQRFEDSFHILKIPPKPEPPQEDQSND